MDILGAIVDRNVRILILVLNVKRDAYAVDIHINGCAHQGYNMFI